MSDDSTEYEKLRIVATNPSDQPNIINAVAMWKKFYDVEFVPLRLEQSILQAFLSNEQFDLTKKNEVLVDHQKAQLRVIDRIVNDFYNKGFSSMRNYQSIDYKINNISSNISLLKYATILVSVICMLIGVTATGRMSSSIGTTIGVISTLIYITIVLLVYRQKLHRNKYDWHKMYWSSPSSAEI